MLKQYRHAVAARGLIPGRTGETSAVASEIAVALISGGVGLTTGIVGSLFAPWANWGIEKRRLQRASRVERIKEWREGVTALREAEKKDGKRVLYRQSPLLTESLTGPPRGPQYIDGGVPDPDYVDVYTKPWFRTLKREMDPEELATVDRWSELPVAKRIGELPDVLDEEINRLERDEWKLV